MPIRGFRVAFSLPAAVGAVVALAGAPASAATYYVRNGGDDSADGRSHATAWASISKVNSQSFSAGDNVLFHAGDRWRGATLVVDWGGTAEQRAVIGAYYVQDGKETRGIRDQRPVIDGEDRRPTRYDALVRVEADRVRVENLDLRNSEGRGITFSESDFSEAVGLAVTNTYDIGIAVLKSDDALVEGSSIAESDKGWLEDKVNWGAAISVQRSARAQIRNNTVTRVYGEGINLNHGTVDGLVEHNYVFGARAVGIYVDASPRATIRRNMVVGTADKRFWRGGKSVGSGIVLCNEPYHYEGGGALDPSVQSAGARVHNNLVAFTNQGLAIWQDWPGTKFTDLAIYNNTFVDNGVQMSGYTGALPRSELANNIFLSLSEGTKDVGSSKVTDLMARNNYFSQGDPGGGLRHDGNRFEGVQIARMKDWRQVDDPSDVRWQDFAPTQLSVTNGNGIAAAAFAAAKPVSPVADEHLDFNATPHNDPPDMGALRWRLPAKTPGAPSGVGARSQ